MKTQSFKTSKLWAHVLACLLACALALNAAHPAQARQKPQSTEKQQPSSSEQSEKSQKSNADRVSDTAKRKATADSLQQLLIRYLDDSIKAKWQNEPLNMAQVADKINATWDKQVNQHREQLAAAKQETQLYLAILGAAALLATLVAFSLGKAKGRQSAPPPSKTDEGAQHLRKQLSERNAEIERLKNERKALAEQLEALRQATKTTGTKGEKSIENESNNAFQQRASEEAMPTENKNHVAPPVETGPQVFYAKYADLEQPAGFSARSLTPTPDDEKIFAIYLVDDEKANFEVVNSYQSFVKANQIMPYFKELCSFDESPTTAHQRIETLQPGQLVKENGGNWRLVQRAKVRFV